MKKATLTIAAFAIALVFALPSLNVFAQTNNTDMGQQNFTATIAIPITVNPDLGTLDLGVVAPGTTKTINVNGSPTVSAAFNVHGQNNWPIEISGTVATSSLGVTLNDIKWELFDNSSAWIFLQEGATLTTVNSSLSATGDAYVRAYPLSMTAVASASADDSPTFDVTVTASYKNW